MQSDPDKDDLPKFVPAYRDRHLLVLAATVVTLYVSVYGETNLAAAVQDPWFYAEIVATAVFTLFTMWLIRRITCRLDKRFDWESDTLKRLFFQLVFGVVLVSGVELVLAAGWFRMLGVNITDTTYMAYAFPMVLLLITVFNAYHYGWYIYLRWQHDRRLLSRLRATEPGAAMLSIPDGNGSIVVDTEQIAYVFHESRSNILRTRDGNNHVVPWSLEIMTTQLSEREFFKLNRKLLVNRTACKNWRYTDSGKLLVELEPYLNSPDSVVSKEKAPRFKAWMTGRNQGRD